MGKPIINLSFVTTVGLDLASQLALVAAAVLAANPHDTQPWLFRISGDAIEVLADLSRNLGAMDAFVREMHLGLGCAIENMLVAAGPNGYDAEVAAVEGSLANFTERRSPVATASVRLKKRAPSAPDGFYRAIALRHTNRYAYERSKAVPADWREFLRRTGDDQGARVILFDEGEDRRAFDAAVVEATQAIIDDKAMIADSDRWFRSSPAEIEAYRDGPTLDAAGLSFFALTYARLFSVSPETSRSAWLRNTRDVQLASAPLTGLIAVSDRYDRTATLAAGRVWQRRIGRSSSGLVTRTIARFRLTGKMAHDDLVRPATGSRLQSSGTPLALCPLHTKPGHPFASRGQRIEGAVRSRSDYV